MKKYIIAGLIIIAGILGFNLYVPLFHAPIDAAFFSTYDVKIHRDTWGVPHIFGKQDKDTAYGLAYAHAEDDFKTIQGTVIAARGKLAFYHGKEGAANDYMVQLLKVWDVVESSYASQLTEETRDLVEAYANGLNHYAVLHPDEVYRGLFPVSGKDVIAGFVHRMPLMYGLDRVLGKLASDEKPEFSVGKEKIEWGPFEQTLMGSNAVAVSPRRSADGYTRLAINSHQPWTGPVAWYEAHLHSEEGWNMTGGLFPGSPVIFLGHNEHLGWAHTVNRPDLIDVYELDIHPDDENKYFIQGKYETIDIWEAEIEMKLWGPFRWTFKRDIMWSIHGPVFKNPHGTFGVRFSGYGEVRQVEQWYQMNKATNYEEFEFAMSLQALPMFNTVYADKSGNISYVYNALMPFRMSDAYDWKGIVPGNTIQSLWQGYIEYDMLPRVVNPESGFVQNCNSTPYKATLGIVEAQMPFLMNNLGIETFQTNRAYRAIETYGADTSITREEFYQYKFDTKYSEKSVMAVNLKKFLSEAASDDPHMREALELLRNWDLDTDSTVTAMHLAYDAIRPTSDPDKYTYNYATIMDRLEKSIEYYRSVYGKINIKWGEIQRLKRGDIDLPLSGGPDIFRAIYSRKQNGQHKATAGDCFYQIVEWSPEGKLSSQSIHQFGSATSDENSPHYNDQAELFATHQMKPVWMTLEDIKLNLEKSYRPGEE